MNREQIIREVANYLRPYDAKAAELALECISAQSLPNTVPPQVNKLNYGIMVEENKSYPAIYTVMQNGLKVFSPQYLKGKDLTESQIKHLYEIGYFNNTQSSDDKSHPLNTGDGWVSVEDGLPEITMGTMSDWVLTFDRSISRIDKAFYSKVTGFQAEHGEEMNVTHWLPLPLPPVQ